MSNDELGNLSTIVDALSAMTEGERRRALNYLDSRFRAPGAQTFDDHDVDELADVMVDAGKAATLGGGGVVLARVILAAGYRRLTDIGPNARGGGA